jgi:hypothetical protein
MRGVRSQPSVIVRPDFASRLVILTQPGDGVAGVPLSTAPVVAVVDQYGNRVPITVPVTVEGASGWWPWGTVTVTAVDGIARFPDIRYYRPQAGLKIQFVSVLPNGWALGSAPSAAFTVVPAAPAELAVTIPPHDTPVGQDLAPAPRVQVRDAYGNDVAVAGIPVTVSLQDASAGTDLTGTLTVTTGADGAAVFTDLQVDDADPFLYLLATAPELSQAASAPFASTPNRSTEAVLSSGSRLRLAGASGHLVEGVGVALVGFGEGMEVFLGGLDVGVPEAIHHGLVIGPAGEQPGGMGLAQVVDPDLEADLGGFDGGLPDAGAEGVP